MTKTLAKACLDQLKAAGVEVIFGLPGVHNLPFWRDQDDSSPKILVPRHEQTTAYAADGLSRATGKPGIALTTTGPGAANTLAAFGEAAASGSPVVVIATEISTQLARSGFKRGVLHESENQAGMFEPLAKAIYRPRSAAQALHDVRMAVETSMQFPRGPVYIDIPTDILDHVLDEANAPDDSGIHVDAPNQHTMQDLELLIDTVDQNDRVVIWAGGGVVQSAAEDLVQQVAEKLNAPVVTTFSARGTLAPAHNLAVGLPPHEKEVAELIEDSDLLLAIGTDFDGMMTRNWTMSLPSTLAIVNVSSVDAVKNYTPDVTVCGDARRVLDQILNRLQSKEPWIDIPQLRDVALSRISKDTTTREGINFVKSVDNAVDGDVNVLCDMAVAGYWFGGYGAIERTRQLQYPVGWGTLGYALPASIGAASSGERTLAICGDGGVMFAISELATIGAERLPITLLIVDDESYGMLAYDQKSAGDQEKGVRLNSPDWSLLGQSFGITTVICDRNDYEFTSVVSKALLSDEPNMVVLRSGLIPPRTTSPRWIAA